MPKATKPTTLIAALALSACTTQTLDEYRPVTDPAARTAARYDADLAACRQIAAAAEADYRQRQDEQMGANIVAGLLVGALLGAAVGDSGDWAAYGAAHGAVAGAASTDTELAQGGPRRIIDRCMSERGHAVLSDLGRG